jgi:hypothetical protein
MKIVNEAEYPTLGRSSIFSKLSAFQLPGVNISASGAWYPRDRAAVDLGDELNIGIVALNPPDDLLVAFLSELIVAFAVLAAGRTLQVPG